jgi:hypothetical protein
MAQPYGAFAKALLETQKYPDLRDASGHPIAPYDVTAHTLSLLTGEQAAPIFAPFAYKPKHFGTDAALEGPKDYGLGLYKSFVPAIDEGWTRWTLDGYQMRYTSVTDREMRSGESKLKFNYIVIPDQAPATILNGYKAGTMPPEYTGGLGSAGVKALHDFVEEGGTLVCLNRASDFAIEQFKLPLRDVVASLSEKEFFVPGSILSIELDTSNPIARGMPKESIAWAEDSPVFEVVQGDSPLPASNVNVIARYPADRNPLLSGWLLGEKRIRGKAALVEVKLGKGRIILFGFRPQYRGQSLATYPLFFNAISGK